MQIIQVSKNSEIKTINQALNLITDDATIYLEAGIYHEKIKLTHHNVTIIGESRDDVVIVNNDYAKKIHQDGLEYNTFRTYTMMILADNVHLENLTIINSSGYGEDIGQAVALSATGDNITITNCSLKAYQDTLFIGPLPKNLITRYTNFLPDDERNIPNHYRYLFTDCYIAGTVDYVFGCGEAYFNNCQFHNLLEGGFVFAPSTYKEDFYGFTVVNSSFTSEVKVPSTFLARPWRDYGKVVLINCIYGNHILDEGFNKWEGTSRNETCRFYEYNSHYIDMHSYKRANFVKELTKDELTLYKYPLNFEE